MLKIFVSSSFSPEVLAQLAESFEVDFFDRGAASANLSAAALTARLQGAQVLITELDRIDGAIMDAAPELTAIIDCRSAPVNIDVEAATKRGIVVLNTPGRNADAVADLTVALMVMALRNVMLANDNLHSGRWAEVGTQQSYLDHMGYELSRKTVGLVGLGFVGFKVARRLRGFDVNLIGYDPFVTAEALAAHDIRKVELDALLQASDVVSLHAPEMAATVNMIDSAEFSLMKPSAYLINTARAALVSEAALLDALRTGKIAGAAIDVFHQEPIGAEHPLLHLPNVVALPHIAGASHNVKDHHARIAQANLMGLINGKVQNVVNPTALDAALARLTQHIGTN